MKNLNKVLVIGSGGREHSLVLALTKSQYVEKIFVAEGNVGIAEASTMVELVPIKDNDIHSLLDFALSNSIDLTIVGPELPLSLGIVDLFVANNLLIFGPSKAAAQIEVSKNFAKELMTSAGVPTANYQSFTDYNEALAYIQTQSFPIVIKYDGLAGGKGVVIAQTMDEAQQCIKDMLLEHKYEEAKVVIEEFLIGEEFSLFAFVRGLEVYPMSPAKDHKRVFDGDQGANTGGMGAYSPVPFVMVEDERFVEHQVLKPIAQALAEQGAEFNGLLYAGLIKTSEGIKVIEFNCRFGDPETEILLPRLESDFFEIAYAIAQGNSKSETRRKVPKLDWNEKVCIGFVLAAKGYPESYDKYHQIYGLDLNDDEEIFTCHMGTTRTDDGTLLSTGGRILMISAISDNFATARAKALACIEQINGGEFHFRRDIGYNLE